MTFYVLRTDYPAGTEDRCFRNLNAALSAMREDLLVEGVCKYSEGEWHGTDDMGYLRNWVVEMRTED